MLKLKLILELKDEPYQLGELSCQYMTRVQKRAADCAIWLGWLPGIRKQVLQWTWSQKTKFDQLDRLYRSGRLN